ncbi:hypothetical protein RvY_12253 [Ramazzottius varieornatus]|uniref:Uncharacterized protein n=1 Tax=Ramazzottius varieornatus TaxID=947166 RepID=A0A1D1VSM3_RAMVA|nr:hypothetical protein RvY_12253 [Ramazzottius varieornatus]
MSWKSQWLKPTYSTDRAKQTSNPFRMIALPNLLQVEQNHLLMSCLYPESRIPNHKVTSTQAADLAYKKRAVAYCINVSSKQRRSLSSVQKLFRKVTSTRQLREWGRHVEEGGSRIDKLKAMRLETGEKFFLAKQKPNVVKDLDIQQWAVTANRKICLSGFTGSPH